MSPPEAKSNLIFVSHKSADKNLAQSIVTLLKGYMDNVSFFVSEDIEKGEEWRANIETALKDADFLLLVYTDATYDWSWCLYEAILFDEIDTRLRGRRLRQRRAEHERDGGYKTTPHNFLQYVVSANVVG